MQTKLMRNSGKSLSSSPKAATGLFLAVAAALLLIFNARGQTPTIFQDDNEVDLASFKGYYVSAFQVHKNGNLDDHHGSSDARIGDRVRIGVIGLGTWLEKLVADGVITSSGEKKHGDQLIDEQLPNIRLFVRKHLLTTLRPSHYFKDDAKWYKEVGQFDKDQAR
jgi:hypothetical protein